MNKKEREERVLKLWAQYNDVLNERQKLEREAKEVKEREEGIKGELCALVPDGSSVAGVTHTSYEKPSVSYSKAFKAVIEEFVPKTRRAEAETVKDAYTSVRVQHQLKEG